MTLANICEHMPTLQGQVVEAQAIRPLVSLVQTAATPPTNKVKQNTGMMGKVECVRHCVKALAKLGVVHGDAIEAAGGVEVVQCAARANRSDQVVSTYASEFMSCVAGNFSMGSATIPVA